MNDPAYITLTLSWLVYFCVDSALASIACKRMVARRRPALMPYYRLGFNLIALAFLIPPLWLLYVSPGEPLWQWRGPWGWFADACAVIAVTGFLWSLRYYDGREFLGLRQIHNGIETVEDQEQLRISPLHRYVRHPWYSLALLIIWTRDMNTPWLISSVAITLYFIVGARLEERKLLAYHGDVYSRYRARVPALIPLPWHRLRPNEARALVRRAQREETPRADAR